MANRHESAQSRVSRKIALNEQTGCWEWTGNLNAYGYARFKINYRRVSVHRWIYEAVVGQIPEGLQIDHLCRNRRCVNPAHLEPVTQTENIRRSPISIFRQQQERTHCPRGHEYSDANTYRHGSHRYCRACHATSEAKRRASAA